MLKIFNILLVFFILSYLSPSTSFATGSNANILSLNTATTNVTTGAYVQIAASSPIATGQIVVQNTTSSILIIATGASGSEVGLVAVSATSTIALRLNGTIPAGTRFSVIALDATASTKYVSVSLIP